MSITTFPRRAWERDGFVEIRPGDAFNLPVADASVDAKPENSRSQSLTGNVILEVLPPGTIEAEPLNYIPTQSMGTRCLNKCV
ncbi:class I SAM-dependent methyltransferase [Dolichospermum sp. UHCC 0315A]|uniref:class I SAM-dependent methyltransferase n=1 Tax=Dolichospermum sp. UHCC 0315A TaxID=1914871 RepID=UPI0011E81ACD|nr:class I SAM-dependent methyltransferase [Dolichospermum sp. UHCC 0315A]